MLAHEGGEKIHISSQTELGKGIRGPGRKRTSDFRIFRYGRREKVEQEGGGRENCITVRSRRERVEWSLFTLWEGVWVETLLCRQEKRKGEETTKGETRLGERRGVKSRREDRMWQKKRRQRENTEV